MRRSAPQSVEDIRHPGAPAQDRRPHALCHATAEKITLETGAPLVSALGLWAEENGYASAVLDLAELPLTDFEYVMPDCAIDDRHVAWYSDTHVSDGAKLSEGVAILGKKEGDWFAHLHACWKDGTGTHLGHLLPHTLTCGATADLAGFGLRGARFETAFDPETEFNLFRIMTSDMTDLDEPPNALITTLAPFEDLCDSMTDLSARLGPTPKHVLGLGSFAGARFEGGAAMPDLISEIFLKQGAGVSAGGNSRLPVRCVDHNGRLHDGVLLPGTAPTLVTCEMLITTAAIA